jgi:phosphoribosylaminoimidazole-succinocarboxamide synthase
MEAVTETALPLKLHSRGKVRDTYELGCDLLMVSTDRISAFDVVFREGVPFKGEVLNRLSAHWFSLTAGIVKNHMVSVDPADFGAEARPFAGMLSGRAMRVRKAAPLKAECIVRGYISGSAWKSYKARGEVCGTRLPPGLKESGKLPEPLFTPTTKADAGHDQDLTIAGLREAIGRDAADFVQEASLKVYEFAARRAESRGIIIADTKMEFGALGDEIILIDELLTPDSSRFWRAGEYGEGRPQKSFDKQFLRDYLEGTGWDKSPPPPPLPPEIISATSRKYVEAFELVTGKKFVHGGA